MMPIRKTATPVLVPVEPPAAAMDSFEPIWLKAKKVMNFVTQPLRMTTAPVPRTAQTLPISYAAMDKFKVTRHVTKAHSIAQTVSVHRFAKSRPVVTGTPGQALNNVTMGN